MAASEDDLWYSKFHKSIKTTDSLTILSSTEKGVDFGADQTAGALLQGFPKSVSVFAELVTLCKPDSNEGITFGSTEAKSVTLSATRLATQVKSSAVVSARGKSGKPNDAGGEDGQAGTHGGPGHTLNVYLGQAPSGSLNVSFDARGGRGATTEADKPARNGGDGGNATVYVVSTWSNILLSLQKTVRTLDSDGLLDEGSDSDESDDGQRQDKLDRIPLTAEDLGRIVGIIRMTSRLCEDSDPLSQRVVTTLEPLSNPTTGVSRSKTVEAIKTLVVDFTKALDNQSVNVRDSISVLGGTGGAATDKDGRRGTRGKDGDAGTSEWHVLRKAITAGPLSGPLSFAPLHPLQCRMQLEKAAALFYFGDMDSLHAAQRVLGRLVARMGAVLDLDSDHSPAIQSLSTKAKDARDKRLRALEEIYKAQRHLLGIPSQIKNPVGELRRIGREAYDMLFRLTRTSVDYYGYQDNWAPRQSVQVFQNETKSSLDELEKSESLFLNLSRRLDKVETDKETRQVTINRAETGRENIRKEQQKIKERLNALRLRIFGVTLKAEIHRRSELLLHALEELKRQTKGNFEFSWNRVLESLGNIAKEIKVSDVIKPRKTKDKYQVFPGKRPKYSASRGKKLSLGPKGFSLIDLAGFGQSIYGKAGGELTNMIYEGINTIPNTKGEHIDKRLIVRQINSIVGDLEKLDKSSMAKLVTDPNTNEIQIDEKQDNLLITSQAQIDKFVEDFVGAAKIGPQAEKAQKALHSYADILADRNHDKLQYNLELKALLKTEEMAVDLEHRETELRNEGFKKDDADQLGQMAQMAEDIYSWDRARTMRLISIYRRAIYLAALAKPGDYKGGHTSDAALTLPAAKLKDMFHHLHDDLFKLQESAGSEASRYPPDFATESGKFVDLSPDELRMLLHYRQIRVTLPASSPESSDDDLPAFRGSAEILRAIKRKFLSKSASLMRVIASTLIAEANRMPLRMTLFTPPPWSYNLLPIPDGGHKLSISESGDIVTDRSEVMAYAAPSPFASWTISLKYLDEKHLDLGAVTRGRFEFFGTTRGFDP